MSGVEGGQDQAPASEDPGPGKHTEVEARWADAAGRHREPQQAGRRRFSWRTPVAVVLIVAGCVLAPVSVLAVWTANRVSDTGRYVANMAPLIKDPAIQNVVADKLTHQIVTQIDVKRPSAQAAAELSHKGVPRIGGLLQSLSGSLASDVQGFVHSGIYKIITRPRIAAAWTQVNRTAHQALVAALSGRGGRNGAIGVSNSQVTLDIAPLEAAAKRTWLPAG